MKTLVAVFMLVVIVTPVRPELGDITRQLNQNLEALRGDLYKLNQQDANNAVEQTSEISPELRGIVRLKTIRKEEKSNQTGTD